jgi:hypothetical protein
VTTVNILRKFFTKKTKDIEGDREGDGDRGNGFEQRLRELI